MLQIGLAIILVAVLAAGAVQTGPSARAQDDPAAEVLEGDSEIEQPLAEEPETEPEPPATDDSEDQLPANDEPAVSDELSENEEFDSAEGDIDEPIATPPAPELVYSPAAEPDCVLAPEQPDLLSHGAYQEFDCTFDLAFWGAYLAPADIQIVWSVQASVDGGWAVQLLPPRIDPEIPSEWTPAQSVAQFTHQTNVWEAPSTEMTDSLDGASQMAFGLRVYRALCDLDPQTVWLDLAADAWTPDLPFASIELQGQQPETGRLEPALAAIPEPAVAFTGPLDFGEIELTSAGPVSPLQPAESVLTITGLDQACGDYQLTMTSTPFDGPTGDETSTIGLALSSIDGTPLPDGDCAFADGCLVAILPAGPDAEPVRTITLGVSLVLPDQPRAAVFDASLTAALERPAPIVDEPVAAQPGRDGR